MKNFFQCILIIVILFNSISLIAQNVGSEFYIEVNKIYLPFDNKGIIADVDFPPNGSGGQFEEGSFLFSSGFWLSGYTNGTLWANGVASASLVEDYLPGIVGMDPLDPKAAIYRLSINDTPFGLSWQNWIDAVELGADFYDGDGDGVYNPVDLNGNNQWDPDEDKPDIFLDETYWFVFNDGVPSGQRRWYTVEPQGIEVRQTIFAMNSPSGLGNTVFVRYRIKNTGLVADTLEDVYFSIWADGDIGDYTDDLYGCDTLRQGIYFYQNTPDAVYGNQVPSFMMDMLAGPRSYIPGTTYIDLNGNNIYENGIDVPIDTAYYFLGPLGIRAFPGAANLSLATSVCFINSDPNLCYPYDMFEARNFTLGKTRPGNVIDPCTFAYGEVRGGVNCSEVNPYFWFSGDHVTDVGWICTENRDISGMSSAGPFTLLEDQEIEILVSYEIGRNSTPLGGITAVRTVSDAVQNFCENNFGYPLVSVEDELNLFSEFALEQNYPNPFNPNTVISYKLPVSSDAVLKVFDVLGNEIATLVDEFKSAGRSEVEFNPTNLTSGVYFYQLRAVDPSTGSGQVYVNTKKMILLK